MRQQAGIPARMVVTDQTGAAADLNKEQYAQVMGAYNAFQHRVKTSIVQVQSHVAQLPGGGKVEMRHSFGTNTAPGWVQNATIIKEQKPYYFAIDCIGGSAHYRGTYSVAGYRTQGYIVFRNSGNFQKTDGWESVFDATSASGFTQMVRCSANATFSENVFSFNGSFILDQVVGQSTDYQNCNLSVRLLRSASGNFSSDSSDYEVLATSSMASRRAENGTTFIFNYNGSGSISIE